LDTGRVVALDVEGGVTALDLRPASPAYCQWTAAELDADAGNALFIPAGCAHGFITLRDDSEISYLMGAAYDPSLARGVRWNDPAFGIQWPAAPAIITERDARYRDFERAAPAT